MTTTKTLKTLPADTVERLSQAGIGSAESLDYLGAKSALGQMHVRKVQPTFVDFVSLYKWEYNIQEDVAYGQALHEELWAYYEDVVYSLVKALGAKGTATGQTQMPKTVLAQSA